jgi:hypothetical protein
LVLPLSNKPNVPSILQLSNQTTNGIAQKRQEIKKSTETFAESPVD